MLTNKPGAHQVSLKDNLRVLFDLDYKIAKATPALLPLDDPQEFLSFFTEEHRADNFIWNNESGDLVGLFSLINLPGPELEILNIGVDPDFQGRGYGRAIVNFVEDYAIKQKKVKIKLVTNIKNLPAVEFYKKVGYKIIKELPNYYGDGETRYLFEKVFKA